MAQAKQARLLMHSGCLTCQTVVNPIINRINNHSIPNFTGNRWIDDSSKVLTVLIWRALDILENLGTIQVTRSSPPTFRDEGTHMSREVCDVYGSKLGTSKMQYLATFNDYIYIYIFTQSSNNIAHESQFIGQWYNCGRGFPIPWWWCDRLRCLRSQSVTWSAVGSGSCARPGLLWNLGGTTLVADELTIFLRVIARINQGVLSWGWHYVIMCQSWGLYPKRGCWAVPSLRV